ncbi:Gfo/Idh/MocA family oxidoreductase [Candidatus Pelagibacter sp.]|nr:Gfo/Idh/MocA family oxidoreductase [Candidatus Pelagibacter sp.]
MFTVAIIGYGYWGPKLSRNFHNSKNFEIKYIIDKSKKKLNIAKSDYPFAIIHNNHRIIDRSKIDLVVISTPTKSHYKLAEFFLKKTNVLIEKPLALFSYQVTNLNKISKKFKTNIFVDYPFIFSGSINFIKKIILNKKYGKLLEVESYREQAPIRKDANVVWDLGVHDISIFYYLLKSNPINIKSSIYRTGKNKLNDSAYINLKYKNGLNIFIRNSWISPVKVRIIKFKFEKAILICDENEPIYKVKIYKKKSDNELLYNVEIPEINLAEPLYNLVEYIAKSLKKKSNDIFKNNLNYKITKVLEKI